MPGYLERDVSARGLKLHYQEWGAEEAPAIVMLHGFGVSGHMFDEFAERMQDRFRLVALDQRGHGDSDWSTDGDYSRQAFVDDLEAFREALGLKTFVLVGHSMGGLNAVAYTVQHPERVRALVLVDVGPEAAKEGVDNIVRFTRGPDELEFDEFVQMAHQFNPRRTIENIQERMRHRLRPLEHGKWTWKFDRRFREPESGLTVGSDLSNDESWQLFRSVQAPTLLVRGSESDVLTQDVAERAASEMSGCRLVVVAGAGHSVPGDNPEGFTQAVETFLDEVTAGRFVPGGEDEAAPLVELVAEHEDAARRRGGSFLVLVAAGAGAMVALAGGAFALRRAQQSRRAKREREEAERRAAEAQAARRLAGIPVGALHAPSVSAADLERARQRAMELLTDLSTVGRDGVSRARTALSSVDLERARGAASDIAQQLGEQARHAPEAVRAAVPAVDREALSARGKSTARKGRTAAGLALAVAKRAPALARGRKPAKKKRRLLRWRN